MSDAVPEAQLKRTELGLVLEGEGWFVLNARDVTWIQSAERGQDTDFEGSRSGPSSVSASRFSLRVSAACTTASRARRTSRRLRGSACS